LFIMGFGYFVAVTALGRPLPGKLWAWVAFWMAIVGVLMALVTILTGQASVLYTFYPPLMASPWFYIGLVLVVAGSWIWCVLMLVAMREWKRENPGRPVPLAMFATVANAVLWLWTTVGMAAELLFQVIPASLGFVQTIDAGLARTLFSWTLHAIVYFWLIPAYIAFYTIVSRAAGGRLYSDTMGRLTFILFLLYSLPVGMHHLLMDPEHGNGWKFIQVLLTAFVAVPTLLTIFTITASLEIAGRLRGGRGVFGWIAALPWDRPTVLATGLSFVMLGFGGFGGLINMGYGMNAMVHNTSWITAHFHLIFGGSAVIMYFAIAYEIWPRLTGREHASPAAAVVAVVYRHDGDDSTLALAGPAGPMAARSQFQLRRSDHCRLGTAGHSLVRRRVSCCSLPRCCSCAISPSFTAAHCRRFSGLCTRWLWIRRSAFRRHSTALGSGTCWSLF
jgi:cytochrome c oxidase subunit I